MDQKQEVATELAKDWALMIPENVTEEAILQLLADQVVTLIERSPEEFFQLMYRLDVSEKKLNSVLQEADVAQQIARLIYNRQLQKIESRAKYRNQSDDADPDMRW